VSSATCSTSLGPDAPTLAGELDGRQTWPRTCWCARPTCWEHPASCSRRSPASPTSGWRSARSPRLRRRGRPGPPGRRSGRCGSPGACHGQPHRVLRAPRRRAARERPGAAHRSARPPRCAVGAPRPLRPAHGPQGPRARHRAAAGPHRWDGEHRTARASRSPSRARRASWSSSCTDGAGGEVAYAGTTRRSHGCARPSSASRILALSSSSRADQALLDLIGSMPRLTQVPTPSEQGGDRRLGAERGGAALAGRSSRPPSGPARRGAPGGRGRRWR
jgi:hypothetical protein